MTESEWTFSEPDHECDPADGPCPQHEAARSWDGYYLFTEADRQKHAELHEREAQAGDHEPELG